MASEDSKLNESDEIVALFQAINHFGFNLYRELAKDKINLFFSPVNLHTALSILFCGSSSDTANEIKHVLGYDLVGLPNEKVGDCFKLLHSALEKTPKSFSLASVNVLLCQKKLAIKENFKNLVSENFKAIVMEDDFTQESTNAVVNDWVRAKTNGIIPNLFYSISAATVMVITNSVCFNGMWLQAFEDQKLYKQLFYNKSSGMGSGVGINMMHVRHCFWYFEEDTFKALELPYTEEDLSMLILLPRERDGLPELEKKVNLDFIINLKTKLVFKEVEVAFPKFHLIYQKSLKSYFENLGLKSIFNPGADFSGISDSKELLITEIFHKATLAVNELGSVEAVSSALDMSNISIMQGVPTFTADHPFMFLIFNTKNDLIFFMGKYEESF